MKIEIKSWITGSVLVEGDFSSLAELLADAARKKANLRGADLTDTNLMGANLMGADLKDADLMGANLRGAHLTDTNLMGANLRGADLKDADLMGANLRGAHLRGADLTDTNLMGANLMGADLTAFRDDVWAVLSAAPAEVMALRSAIIAGRIDGSVYEGECACLVGTLEKHRPNDSVEIGLRRDDSRLAERWFLRLKVGDTPENDWTAKVTLEWVDQWISNVRGAVKAGVFASEEGAK